MARTSRIGYATGAVAPAAAEPRDARRLAPVGGADGVDDDHSSRRRARDGCIAGAVRWSVQLEIGVEVQQRCVQRQRISRGRAIQCLPTFARMTGSKRRRTHIARRGRGLGATVRAATPRRCKLESRRRPARHGTRGLPRGCRVITVSSGGFKTIPGWLRTSLAVIVIGRFCCRPM
jgi:hypothetical protein